MQPRPIESCAPGTVQIPCYRIFKMVLQGQSFIVYSIDSRKVLGRLYIYTQYLSFRLSQVPSFLIACACELFSDPGTLLTHSDWVSTSQEGGPCWACTQMPRPGGESVGHPPQQSGQCWVCVECRCRNSRHRQCRGRRPGREQCLVVGFVVVAAAAALPWMRLEAGCTALAVLTPAVLAAMVPKLRMCVPPP